MFFSERLTVLVAVFVLISTGVNGNEQDLLELDKIRNEKECIIQGGLCVIESDCPLELRTASKGLCPEQREKGVECCYGLSMKETRCAKRGGNCIKKEDCGRAPVDKWANDCGDEVCLLAGEERNSTWY